MAKRMVQIVTLVLLLAVAGWFGFREGGTESNDAAGSIHSGTAAPANSVLGTPPPAAGMNAVTTPAEGAPANRLTTQSSGGEMLHEWLTSSQDVAEIADTILRGWPKLQPEDHAMAAKELIPLVTDDRYLGLRTLLLDPKTSVEAKELIFKNLILRPKDVNLPLFLAVLRQSPPHPSADDARNQLIVRLGEDYGTDWAKWQARINEEVSP